jgi:D-arabinose 1-dehydrogenase-like Zn-dependent alcohol dehydrogenase
LSEVRAIIEPSTLADAGKAYDRMLQGDARFRMVLTV